MENTTANPVKAVKNKRAKGVAKAVTAFTVGAALLFGGNTFAVWKCSQSLGQHQTITAGELSIDRARSAGSWTLNGTTLAESELSSVKLVPGDTVAYAGSEAPRVVGDTLIGWMYFQGLEAIQNSLAGAAGATMAWSVAGKQESKELTSADHLVDQPVAFSVSLDAGSDNASQALTVDLSGVQIAVSMLNPSGTTPPPPVDGEDPSAPWVINDPTVRQAVLSTLSVPDASELQESDKTRLTSLQLRTAESASLADVKGMTSLTKLRLDHTGQGMEQVLSTLGTAPQIKDFEFYGYYIEDENGLAGLAGLTGLEKLYANGIGKTTTLAPLAGLKNLKNAKISNAGLVTDLSPLAGLNLTSLDISTARALTDLSPLSGMSSLASLSLTSMESLSDLSPLAGLTGLEALDVTGSNKVSDISTLASLTNLRSLEVSGTSQLTSIEVTRGLTHLQELYIHASDLTDLKPLSSLTGLKKLDLTPSWTVTDISALAPLTGLEQLSLQTSEVTDLSALAGMTSMRSLAIYTAASDLTALAGMTELEELEITSPETRSEGEMNGWTLEELLRDSIGNHGVTSLEPLRNLESLRNFSISGGSFDDVTPLSQLPRLRDVTLQSTWVEDISSLDHVYVDIRD